MGDGNIFYRIGNRGFRLLGAHWNNILSGLPEERAGTSSKTNFRNLLRNQCLDAQQALEGISPPVGVSLFNWVSGCLSSCQLCAPYFALLPRERSEATDLKKIKSRSS